MNHPPLVELIDMCLHGWTEKIEYATRLTDCTEQCNAWKTYLSLVELRHYACDCPTRVEYRKGGVKQAPLLTQLFEAKVSVPVSGEQGGGNPNKSESQMPGNLVVPDLIESNIRVAVVQILADWTFTSYAAENAHLAATHTLLEFLQLANCYDDVTNEMEDDAVALLWPHIQAALTYLGYQSRRVFLVDTTCGQCGGQLSYSRDDPSAVYCEGDAENGPCGLVYGPEDFIRLHEVEKFVAAARGACTRGHAYSEYGRRTKRGTYQCKECDRARKAKIAARMSES